MAFENLKLVCFVCYADTHRFVRPYRQAFRMLESEHFGCLESTWATPATIAR